MAIHLPDLDVLAATHVTHPDAVGGNLALSAFAGIVPLLAFFVFLMVLKWKAYTSALGAVGVALVIAVWLFGMPAQLAGLSLLQGIAFGLFPVVFIIWMAVWIYELTVKSKRFDDLRTVFSKIGRGDMRVQAMLIGFAFGGLLEALAGFGAPIAIVAAMLLAIGMEPMKAALVTLVANAAPVAFGAMAIPVTTAGLLTDIPPVDVAAMAGRQVSVLALVVPFALCVIMDGMRGLRQVWPMALVLGVSFGGGQFLASNYFSYELTDVVACLLSLTIGILFLRVWGPKTPEDQASKIDTTGETLTPKRVGLALFPYLLIVVVFAITSLWRIGFDLPAALHSTDLAVEWPGLHGNLYTESGDPITGTVFNFNWLSNPGTILFGCGVITSFVYSATHERGKYPMTIANAFAQLFRGAYTMRFSALTIASVMGLAYVMNFSGQTGAIGAFLAGTGALFPLISPLLGWIGTAVTGSATSSNALFAQMQHTAATEVGVNQTLMVAANTSGATLGKMMSPQTLTIVASSVKMENGEGDIMKKAWKYSFGLLAFMCVLVFLQSTGVLGWMVVG